MGLDDRLGSASKRRNLAVDEHIEDLGLNNWENGRQGVEPVSSTSVGYYWLAAAAVLIFGGFAFSQRPDNDPSGVDAVAPSDGISSTTTITTEDTLDVTTTGAQPSSTTTSAATSTTSADKSNAGGNDDAAEVTVTTAVANDSGERSSTLSPTSSTPEPEPTTTDPTVGGVVNDVCGTGYRAELEEASLRYISESTGWGTDGLTNLTNEQNGPHYYRGWEPNFDGTVTVELILAQPVMATEIRLAQDPFTAVSGTIELTVGQPGQEQSFDIQLSGMDGWRSHQFGSPTYLKRLTVTRRTPPSNVMEVVICTENS